jgi:hypothetical protein
MSETEVSEWNPRINCAIAASRDQFCIALTELEYDDPFSAIISYDGRLRQPWGRTDVRREINSVCVMPDMAPETPANYAALSNEGDVYLIGSTTLREKIHGAGIQSPDATGLGATFEIFIKNNSLWVTGANGQLYERNGPNNWLRLPFESSPNLSTEVTVDLSRSLDLDSLGALILGIGRQTASGSTLDTDQNLVGNDSWDDWFAAIDTDASAAGDPDKGSLFHWNTNRIEHLEIPATKILNDIYKSSNNEIWIVGYEGIILKGNIEVGFSDVSFHGDHDKNLLSITEFGNRMVVASDYALHWFDGHILTPLKPKINPFINRNVPTPLKVQALDGVLFYFDYKHGVHRYDGENWEEIVIPPELLEREFKGMRR